MRSLLSLVLFFSGAAYAQQDISRLLKDLPEVVRNGDTYVSELSGPRYSMRVDDELQSLLPSRFKAALGKNAQPLIDHLTERLFDAASARQAFCFLGAEASKDFVHFLGVSRSTARHLKDKCRDVVVSKWERRYLKLMKMSILQGPTLQRAKVFGFVFTQDNFPEIEGFSTKDGITLIAVNESEASEIHLLRLLTHELAISFDQLSVFIPQFSTQSWERGLEALFPLKKSPIFREPEELHELRCALRDPAIRYGAAVERALRFEDQVVRDLGLLKSSSALASKKSCARTIGERAVQIAKIASVISWETDLGTYTECGVGVLRDGERRKTLVGRIERVARTRIFPSDGSAPIDLCDLILNPHVGPRLPENSRHGGPRPRIGGW